MVVRTALARGVAAAALACAAPALAFLGPWSVELPPDARFPRLLADADLVAAVTVVRVEPGRDGADEPSWIEVRVEAAVKGPAEPGAILRFAESDWCGPAWGEGQMRLAFLRGGGPDPGPAPGSPWWSMCPVTGKLDCHLDPRDATLLTSEAVERFLRELSAARSSPPVLDAVLRREGVDVLAEVVLANPGGEGVWFDPARVQAHLMVGGMRRAGVLRVEGSKGWTLLPAGSRLEGVVRFPGAAGEDLTRKMTVILGSDAALFPRRCWTGTVSTPAALRPFAP